VIVSATFTPLHGQLNPAAIGGTCDLSRIGLAPLRPLLHVDDTKYARMTRWPLCLTAGSLLQKSGDETHPLEGGALRRRIRPIAGYLPSDLSRRVPAVRCLEIDVDEAI
jgi:hypothetical protein